MPVNRRALPGTIDEFDFHGLPTSEHDGRPDQLRSRRFRRWRRRLGEVAQLEGVGWPDAAAAFIEGELQIPFGMPSCRLRTFASAQHCNAEYQASHAGVLRLCRIGMFLGSCRDRTLFRLPHKHLPFRRRHVNQHMAVK